MRAITVLFTYDNTSGVGYCMLNAPNDFPKTELPAVRVMTVADNADSRN